MNESENKLSRPASPRMFGAFNARDLSPEGVARTFVPSPHFFQLLASSNTVVVGPRGSGKTTLLKMLDPEALSAWTHPEAANARAGVGFVGIFVATDNAWREQTSAHFVKPGLAQYATAAFTTHCLRALVRTMEKLVHPTFSDRLVLNGSMTREAEASLARMLSKQWSLTLQVPSLAELRYALTVRLGELAQRASAERIRGSEGRSERLAEQHDLHLDFLESGKSAVEAFRERFRTERGAVPWAWMFDELELASTDIRRRLLRCLRGEAADFFRFKLSLSPHTEELDELARSQAGAERHDYDLVHLWYSQKQDGLDFSRTLFQSVLKARGIESELEAVLGPNPNPDSKRQRKHVARKFASLAERDPTFREYLARNLQIDSDIVPAIVGLTGARANEVRKITRLVLLREAVVRSMPEETAEPVALTRSRKKVKEPFVGEAQIFAMTEGNPRWILTVANAMIASSAQNRLPSQNRDAAYDAILSLAEAYVAWLRVLPAEGSSAKSRNVATLIAAVAGYFSTAAVRSTFSADPVGTFVVDRRCTQAVVSVLGRALNVGAIVHIPGESGHALLDDLRGERFRITYLLAPIYTLPLQLGRPAGLWTILEATGIIPVQTSLPFDNDWSGNED